MLIASACVPLPCGPPGPTAAGGAVVTGMAPRACGIAGVGSGASLGAPGLNAGAPGTKILTTVLPAPPVPEIGPLPAGIRAPPWPPPPEHPPANAAAAI